MCNPMLSAAFLFALSSMLCASAAGVETQNTAQPAVQSPAPARGIDVTIGAQHLSDGYGQWRSLVARGVYERGAHVWQGELSARQEFGADGVFGGIGDTVTLNPDMFGSLAIGAGDGAFFLPRFRADAALSRKLLDQKNLVVTVGAGYYNAPDGHRDRSVSLGGAYYFVRPLVIEAGVRHNRSNPGAVNTHQQFLAATIGRNHENLVVARAAWGSEGYLAIGPATSLVGFDSNEFNLSWRHWMTKRMGLLSTLSHYHNPTYDRSGLDVGTFFEFD